MYYITCDATCDLPKIKRTQKDFFIMPMNYTIEDETYSYGKSDSTSIDDFYQMIKEEKMPVTSCVTPHMSKGYWTEFLKEGKDVLHISFSSGLSSTYNNDCISAKELMEEYPDRKILVIDSLSATMGEAQLVVRALENREKGISLQDNYNDVLSLVPNICHFFTVDDLNFLQRGGRISKTAAFIGSAMHVKPIMHMDEEGHLIPIGKAISRKMSLKTLCNKTILKYKEGDIYIANSKCIKDAEFCKNKLQKEFPDINIYIEDLGPVIGSHTGIGCISIMFIGKDRLEK